MQTITYRMDKQQVPPVQDMERYSISCDKPSWQKYEKVCVCFSPDTLLCPPTTSPPRAEGREKVSRAGVHGTYLFSLTDKHRTWMNDVLAHQDYERTGNVPILGTHSNHSSLKYLLTIFLTLGLLTCFYWLN